MQYLCSYTTRPTRQIERKVLELLLEDDKPTEPRLEVAKKLAEEMKKDE